MAGDKETVKRALAEVPELELAVLIGSRATGMARADSDWDIAIQWRYAPPLWEESAATERLRRLLAQQLALPETRIDLILIPGSRLAIRSVIAEEGIVLKGEESLAWSHLLLRTWRELEEVYWEAIYAA
jgi:predicted nucleotidyltransferase